MQLNTKPEISYKQATPESGQGLLDFLFTTLLLATMGVPTSLFIIHTLEQVKQISIASYTRKSGFRVSAAELSDNNCRVRAHIIHCKKDKSAPLIKFLSRIHR